MHIATPHSQIRSGTISLHLMIGTNTYLLVVTVTKAMVLASIRIIITRRPTSQYVFLFQTARCPLGSHYLADCEKVSDFQQLCNFNYVPKKFVSERLSSASI